MSRTKNRRPEGRLVRFGPGTVMALLGALYLIGSGWVGARAGDGGSPGVVVYRADRNGKLQRVEQQVRTEHRPALWKPEPSLLLSDGSLGLTGEQRRQVSALDAAWRRDKARLESGIRGAVAGLEPDAAASGRGASIAALRQRLQPYAEMSREYDARRADYWARAVAELTPRQRDRASRLGRGAGDGAR